MLLLEEEDNHLTVGIVSNGGLVERDRSKVLAGSEINLTQTPDFNCS